MSVAERWMDVISHNLANASTTAFKRDVMVFNEGFERLLANSGGEGESIGRLGAGPEVKGVFTVWEMGGIAPTGNDFDVALATENGMFQVRSGNGSVSFTRDGAWALSPERTLVTKNGSEVLDAEGQPITIPPGQMVIGRDGAVEVNGQRVGQIAVFTGAFSKNGNGEYASNNAVAMTPDTVQIQQRFIESSNVNAIEEMISMIKLNRAFEMAQRSAQSQDESTGRLIQILQGR